MRKRRLKRRATDGSAKSISDAGDWITRMKKNPPPLAPVRLTGARLAIAGLPRMYWKASIADIPDCEHRKFAQKYIAEMKTFVRDGVGLLLWGENRRGKTHLAAAIMKEAIKKRLGPYFIRAADLVGAVFGKQLWDEDEAITVEEHCRETKLLILDDLGKEQASKSDAAQLLFDNIIRYRQSEGRATIITTNLEPRRNMHEALKESTVLLLRECCYPIEVAGVEYNVVEAAHLAERFQEG